MQSWAAEHSGIARVTDGDTIVIGETRIRLEGIDSPEASQTCGRKWVGTWACGTAATNALAKLAEGHTVTCREHGRDSYGRVLGTCFSGGVEINAEMVRQGYAWAFVKYSTTYAAQEATARSEKIGIWQGESMPPWEFRAQRWTHVIEAAPEGCPIKGNVTRNGRIYHTPWSPWYDRIKVDKDQGERWFCSESEALAAGWRPAHIH